MKLYRDLTEGEVLQPGDLYRLRNSDMDWCEHTEEQAAEMPDATVGFFGRDDLEWRRPVDAVPREQLAEERMKHGRTAHGKDALYFFGHCRRLNNDTKRTTIATQGKPARSRRGA